MSAAPAATCRCSSTRTCRRPSGTVTYAGDWRAARRPGGHDPDLHRRPAEPELRTHHHDLRRRRVEVQRAGAAGEPPPQQGPAVPGQLHRGARDRQRPELADLHLWQQRAEPVRLSGSRKAPRTSRSGTASSPTRFGSPTFGAPGTTTNKLFSGFTISPTLVDDLGCALHRRADRQHAEHRACPDRRARRRRIQPPAVRFRATPISCRRTADLALRVSRAFTIPGSHKIEAILDVFNLTNRLNYTQVNTTMYAVGGTAAAPTLTYNPTFRHPDQREQQLLRVHAPSGSAGAPLHVLGGGWGLGALGRRLLVKRG